MNPLTALLGSGLRAVRTLGIATAVVGVAVLGASVAAPPSPVASASGPDVFIQRDHGVLPVFFCDALNPNRQQNLCVDLDGPRF
jgi:hypothetical protein